MKLLAVITTVGAREQAQAMGRTLVERGLAACAQIERIESYYTWDGQVQHDEEFRILFKTTAERYEAVEAAIRELHGYDLPAIHAVEVERAYEPYAQWVADCTAGPAGEDAGGQNPGADGGDAGARA